PADALDAQHDAPEIVDDAAEAVEQATALAPLAAIKRDTFGVLAQAHQVEAEIGLVALLIEIELHQRAADLEGEPGSADGVDDREPQHVAGNGDAAPGAQRDGQRSRQRPQDRHEGEQRHRRTEKAQRQSEAGAGEAVEILGDALVGIVGPAIEDLHAVIGALIEPGIEIAARQPAPPADLQHLLEIGLVDDEDDPQRRENREDEQLLEKAALIVILQRIIELVAPFIEADIDVDGG